jgi:hypothetical protein
MGGEHRGGIEPGSLTEHSVLSCHTGWPPHSLPLLFQENSQEGSEFLALKDLYFWAYALLLCLCGV